MSRWRWVGWVVLALGAGGLLNPPFPHGVATAAIVLVALSALTLVRELGRLAVGTAIGLRAAIVEIGEGRLLLRTRTGSLRWRFSLTAIASVTVWSPPPAGTPVRARLAVLALVRPAVTAAIVLGIHALHVPGLAAAHGRDLVLAGVRAVAEGLLLLGLVPFSLRGAAIVPFESDGLKLSRLLFPKGQRFDQDFARFYFASSREALEDGDPARALALCREGIALFGPPWSEALRAMETHALSRAGDRGAARAEAERALARDLPPLGRALALNGWSWYAFLDRDEADLRLADRRSADALVLKADSPAMAGTRGAVLLWRGRVGEALPFLERGYAGAYTQESRDINACLLAMAHAARGELERARTFLGGVKSPDRTEGLWAEANRFVRLASDPHPTLSAARGRRSLAVVGDALELREGNGAVRRLVAADLARVEVGETARGRALVTVGHGRGNWRLPIGAEELTWARSLLGRVFSALGESEPSVASVEGAASLETQERAYEERAEALKTGVSTPKGIVFFASLVAFGASMLMLYSSWRWLGMIVPVLFFHELGHWLAMRAFGHQDASISFIPFLGAATMTRTPFEKRWQEVVMLLAGPVPGILLGVGLLFLPLGRHTELRVLASVLISINAANLLPLHPLDGGRILHALVTAGRPRLDLLFKTGASAAFLAGGLASHQPVLTFLGLFGMVFWRQAWRLSRLEARIRRTPGFDPRLPSKVRRAYVFRVLAQEPALSAKDWASTVAALEMPLGYRPTPGWQIGVGALLLVAGLTGVGLLARRAFQRLVPDVRCPPMASAVPVSCADAPAFATIPWKTPVAGPVEKSSPDDSSTGEVLSREAFVWCASRGAALVDLKNEFTEAELGARYCQALPWERPVSDADGVWRKARWTLRQLRYVMHHREGEGMDRFDRRVELERGNALFDAETARLLREMALAADGRPGAAWKELAARLGRSPSSSCERLQIHNVGWEVSPGEALRFNVSLKEESDFGPLGTYLCRAGCTLAVLPTDPADPRADYCR